MDSQPLVDALADVVVPLASTAPADVAEALRGKNPSFADRRVVGMGEATHGTREFFRAKHGVVRYLVEERGFRLFGLEAGFAATRSIDEYVVHGIGDPAKLLESVHDVWRTAEMVALLEWFRAFNRGRPAADRVRVYGFDVQSARASVQAVEAYLERADPEYVSTIEADLVTVREGIPVSTDDEATRETARRRLAAAERLVTAVEARFEERREAYVSRTSESDWELARRHVAVLDAARRQRAARLDGDDGDEGAAAAVRERSMAETVAWLLEHAPGDRIVLWAHNEHVQTGDRRLGAGDDATAAMGRHLRERFGADYYALGLEFGTGGWVAAPGTDARAGQLREYADESIPADALAAPLSRLPQEALLLDCERAGRDERVRDWLADDHRMHSIPGIMALVEDPYVDVRVPAAFDGLLYVDEATGSRTLLPMQ